MESTIQPSKNIFGTYMGLLIGGYDLANPDQDKTVDMIIQKALIQKWRTDVVEYFRFARRDTCGPNPYWPRAFFLTVASIFLGEQSLSFPDKQRFICYIQGLDMINPSEREESTLNWVIQLPKRLSVIRDSPLFDRCWRLYCEVIDKDKFEEGLQKAISIIEDQLGIDVSNLPTLITTPNPLQSPYSVDFVELDDELYIITAEPDVFSILHELCHKVFSTAFALSQSEIEKHKFLLGPILDDMIKLQYAWKEDLGSWNRVFEESFVRSAVIWLKYVEDDVSAIKEANFYSRQGFIYIPVIVEQFMKNWTGMANAGDFVRNCLEKCSRI